MKRSWIRIILLQLILATFVTLGLLFALSVVSGIKEARHNGWKQPAKVVTEDQITVLGESDVNGGSEALHKSENYRLSQLSVGGEIMMEMENTDPSSPIAIADVKSELFVTKNNEETRMLISWKTNKPTKAFVEYARQGEASPKRVEEQASEGYTHTLVLPALQPSSVYTYALTCKDRWGGQQTSDKFVLYTGEPNVSLMDVLEDAAKKTFGWAM